MDFLLKNDGFSCKIGPRRPRQQSIYGEGRDVHLRICDSIFHNSDSVWPCFNVNRLCFDPICSQLWLHSSPLWRKSCSFYSNWLHSPSILQESFKNVADPDLTTATDRPICTKDDRFDTETYMFYAENDRFHTQNSGLQTARWTFTATARQICSADRLLPCSTRHTSERCDLPLLSHWFPTDFRPIIFYFDAERDGVSCRYWYEKRWIWCAKNDGFYAAYYDGLRNDIIYYYILYVLHYYIIYYIIIWVAMMGCNDGSFNATDYNMMDYVCNGGLYICY